MRNNQRIIKRWLSVRIKRTFPSPIRYIRQRSKITVLRAELSSAKAENVKLKDNLSVAHRAQRHAENELARFMAQSAMREGELQAELAACKVDAERLDSGMIITHERDEFGDEYTCERRGINLRASIDAAIDAARKEQPLEELSKLSEELGGY